jgi:hypothetical protein
MLDRIVLGRLKYTQLIQEVSNLLRNRKVQQFHVSTKVSYWSINYHMHWHFSACNPRNYAYEHLTGNTDQRPSWHSSASHEPKGSLQQRRLSSGTLAPCNVSETDKTFQRCLLYPSSRSKTPLQRRSISIKPQGETSQKTDIFIHVAVRTLNHTFIAVFTIH